MHRRIVIGSVDRLVDETAARQAVFALCIDINASDAGVRANATAISDLAEHYRQRELRPDNVGKYHRCIHAGGQSTEARSTEQTGEDGPEKDRFKITGPNWIMKKSGGYAEVLYFVGVPDGI